MWKAIIPGLVLLTMYVVGVLILSGVCAKFVDYVCPKTDNHKKFKISHIPIRSRNIHRP